MSEAAAIVQPSTTTSATVAAVGRGRRWASFVGNDLFRREAFGRNHPLSIHRQGAVLDLCEILGWLDASTVNECPLASEDQLGVFHDPAYLRVLRKASASGRIDVADRERYAVGTMENPLFPGVYERAACTVGGSILAARLAMEGQAAFHPAGGTHHGRPDRAAGFCYFNDPVFAILTLLEEGAGRVMYVDLDAHHGDGVQAAFEHEPRVMTVSIHERERWPYSGALEDRGGGLARNLPVPPGFNDSELEFLLDRAVLPLLEDFDPAALVITCGADALAGDPLSKLELSNGALWNAVERLLQRRRSAVVLGGGGYNPWTTVRCWAGLWGVLAGRDLPARLPPRAVDLLAGLECDLVDEEDLDPAWLETLADRPNLGPVRDEVRAVAEHVLDGKERA